MWSYLICLSWYYQPICIGCHSNTIGVSNCIVKTVMKWCFKGKIPLALLICNALLKLALHVFVLSSLPSSTKSRGLQSTESSLHCCCSGFYVFFMSCIASDAKEPVTSDLNCWITRTEKHLQESDRDDISICKMFFCFFWMWYEIQIFGGFFLLMGFYSLQKLQKSWFCQAVLTRVLLRIHGAYHQKWSVDWTSTECHALSVL